MLGEPDCTSSDDTLAITLGYGGFIVFEFGVNIMDVEGQDIYIFECGGAEAKKVEVSNDLKNWIYVGDANRPLSGVDYKGGSVHGVDIKDKVPPGAVYTYIRITDLKTDLGRTWPGADIDAVAVVY